MPRSRLQPFKDDIAEALAAGTSVRHLARTYGVAQNTMAHFVGKHLGHGDCHVKHAARCAKNRQAINARSAAWRVENPEKVKASQANWQAENRLRICQYDTLRYAQQQAERSRQRAEETR